ncbi:glycerophosphodiester phosphodiesterase [Effusibacillus dendaii]|nr:glycerophosphodiester phosphodiesterase [Effusibacillus dendaii]
MIIGHRGASAYAPENTFSAFKLAQKLGCHGLEFDVQLTRDGVPIVIHDETLDRTTNHVGQVSNFLWKEIQLIDAGLWKGEQWRGERIPALEDVLTECKGMYLNIELKNSKIAYPGLEETIVRLIERYCDIGNVIVSSFNHSSLQQIKKLAPHIQTGVLYERQPKDAVSYIKNLGGTAAHPNFRFVKKEQVDAFHQEGISVSTWTVNSLRDLKAAIRSGVDRIITNYPDRLRDLLQLTEA